MRGARTIALLLLLLVAALLVAGTQVGASRSPLLVTPDAVDATPGPLRFPPHFYWSFALDGSRAGNGYTCAKDTHANQAQ